MASHEGSTLISHLIAQHLFVLHLRLGLVLNNCPSENDFALIAVVNRPSGYSSQSRWDELSKHLRLKNWPCVNAGVLFEATEPPGRLRSITPAAEHTESAETDSN